MTDLVKRLRDFSDEAASVVTGDRIVAMAAADEIERLRRFVEFVALWSNREAPFQAEECLHMIKHHPVAQAAMKEAA